MLPSYFCSAQVKVTVGRLGAVQFQRRCCREGGKKKKRVGAQVDDRPERKIKQNITKTE